MMSDYCVILANGSRARFFTLEKPRIPSVDGGPNLVERQDLVNREVESHDRGLWSDPKTGCNRSPGGGQAHGYDDHRSRHVDEFKRRFARDVARNAARVAQTTRAKNVIVAAQKRMLGFLRDELDPLVKTGVNVHNIAKDLSKLAPDDVHRYLAKERLVPRRKNPGA